MLEFAQVFNISVVSFVFLAVHLTVEWLFVLQENGSSEEHVLYVWDHFVSKAAAKNVFIVAHSYGGLSFVELVSVSVFRLSFLPPTDTKDTLRHTVGSCQHNHSHTS